MGVPVNPPGGRLAADDGTLNQVPGSTAAFSLTQLRDFFNLAFAPAPEPQ
jgi:hypothetical protein